MERVPLQPRSILINVCGGRAAPTRHAKVNNFPHRAQGEREKEREVWIDDERQTSFLVLVMVSLKEG